MKKTKKENKPEVTEAVKNNEKKSFFKSVKNFFISLNEQVRKDKKAFAVYLVLRVIVIAVMVRCAFQGRWESFFVGALALILMMLPPFVEKSFKLDLPTGLEIIIFVFVFCAEILGEIECYYIKFAFWDTMLHTVNGFVVAAIGFCLVDLLNKNKNIKLFLSPIYLSVIAICFSMTIGILWEFFEFSGDFLVHTDMQKDFVVDRVDSVYFDETNSNISIHYDNIVKTTIETADGKVAVIEGGYLDIGIKDTMKDLFVNFIGAIVFSIIGYFYVQHRGKGTIAEQLIPTVLDDDKDE